MASEIDLVRIHRDSEASEPSLLADMGANSLKNEGTPVLNVPEKGTGATDEVKGKEGDEEGEEKKKDEAPPKKVSFRQLYRYITWKDRLLLLLGCLGSIALGASMPVFSIVFGELLDSFGSTEAEMVDNVRKYAVYVIYVGAGAFVAAWLGQACFMIVAENNARRIRAAYMQSVLSQEIAWFDTQKAGAITTRLASDSRMIQDATGEKVGMILQQVAMLVTGMSIGFVFGWQLALVILAVTPLMAIVGAVFTKVMTDMTEVSQQHYAKAGGIASETLGAMRTVASFSQEESHLQQYVVFLKDAMAKGMKKSLAISMSLGMTLFVMFGSYGLALWYGGKLVSDQTHNSYTGAPWTAGDVMGTFFAVLMGAMALGQAAPHFPTVVSGQVAAANVFEIIDRQSAINSLSDKGKKLKKVEGRIELKNVTFAYQGRERKVLTDFNLSIQPGEKVALVGASGCGKSTIVSLLERYYDPTEGVILVDGEPLTTLNVTWWRQQLGLVSQEPLLFATTIVENIKYGNAEATMQEVEAAARAANAHGFISQLKDGYNTMVGEEGRLLSGGQKQRIAIARAMLKSPSVLLLDEATSALDNENEAVVQKALEQVMKGRTTLMIAHRLSTVRDADRIIVLSEGGIQEMGRHEELMQKRGIYWEMVQTQERLKDQQAVALESKHAPTDSEHPHNDNVSSASSSIASSPLELKKQPSLSNTNTNTTTNTNDTVIDINTDTTNKAKSKDGKDEEKKRAPEKLSIPWTRLFYFNKPEWGSIFIGFVGGLASGASWPLWSLMFAKIVAVLFITDYGKMRDEIAVYAGGFAAIGFGLFVATVLRMGLIGIAGEKMTARLRELLFRTLLRQEVGWFDQPENTSGVLVTRLANDASAVQALTGERLGQLSEIAGMMGVGLGLAFSAGWKMSLVVLAVAPLMAFAGLIQMQMTVGFSGKIKELLESLGQRAQESITHIRTVAAFTGEATVMKNFNELLDKNSALGIKNGHTSGIGMGVSQIIIFASYGLAFWYGSVLVEDGEMTLEDVLQVFFAILMIAMGIGQVGQMSPDFGKATHAANDIFKLIDRQSKIDPMSADGQVVKLQEGGIQLSHIEFEYPTRPGVKVFEDFSLSVPARSSVALVGGSGSGKSTVIALLQRFYDPMGASQILVDGSDIKRVNIRNYRSQIGTVGQEPVLFSGSIRENILYGRPEATEAEMVDAAKAAYIHDVIMKLPEQYDTNIGAKGLSLSGGQKQRIAIARAIIRKPALLLLDEATSALDSASEDEVQRALDSIMVGRTTVMVAHRLSTVRKADYIVVMDQGRVVEGPASHETLMEKNGVYASLVRQNIEKMK